MISRRQFIHATAATLPPLFFSQKLTQSFGIITPGAEWPGLRYRQVHLDYHNSELFEDLARDFDPEQFADTLKKASVNSVTAFGRCHHGYIYHDSIRFSDRRHPHLKRNLLGEQIEACHKNNIRVPVYVTVQWDHLTARQHPEWLVRDENGAPVAFGDTNQFKPGFYNHLCVATPYRDFLKSYLADLFEQVPVDGLFLDIHHVLPNANTACVEGMLRKGQDPSNAEVRRQFYAAVLEEYKADLTAFIRRLDKTCSIFYNGGHIGPQVRSTLPANSHLELESLPSGGWGYLHFPLTARFARNLGLNILGMTGKFHTSWGDFHSLKNRAALEFETNTMLALNAGCSVGDQLHPRGKLDAATYDLIGSVYAQVAEKEPWCQAAKALTDIGVISTEEFTSPGTNARTPEPMLGAVRMLQEGGHQFDVLDSQSDFASYRVLLLPDHIPVGERLAQKLTAYLRQGGSVLLSHRAGLRPDGTDFAVPEFGVSKVADEAPFSPDFINPSGPLGRGLPATELVMYLRAVQVRPVAGSTVLCAVNVPYFNREWNHFSSHKHTPSSGKPGYPGVVQAGRVIYFSHPIFTQYARNAPLWCRKLVLNALERLLPHPLVRHDGPSSVVVTLNRQTSPAPRQILHLLHYVPERRGAEFDVIEEVLPLHQLAISVRAETPVRRVELAPQGTTLPFRQKNGRVKWMLPVLNGHQMVVLT